MSSTTTVSWLCPTSLENPHSTREEEGLTDGSRGGGTWATSLLTKSVVSLATTSTLDPSEEGSVGDLLFSSTTSTSSRSTSSDSSSNLFFGDEARSGLEEGVTYPLFEERRTAPAVLIIPRSDEDEEEEDGSKEDEVEGREMENRRFSCITDISPNDRNVENVTDPTAWSASSPLCSPPIATADVDDITLPSEESQETSTETSDRRNDEVLSIQTGDENLPPTTSPLNGEAGGSMEEVVGTSGEEGVPLFSRNQTLLFFDWDDTLLPSTWLNMHQLTLEEESVVPSTLRPALNEMAEYAQQTLELASSYGTVVLVTNAEEGWITISCQKFLPTLAPHLANYRQISARSHYESPEISSPFSWKQLAFRNEIVSLFENASKCEVKNIVSFGDSTHERLALLTITREVPLDEDGFIRLDPQLTIPECPPSPDLQELIGPFRSKSVKFLERPQLEDLKREHNLITRCIYDITQRDLDLDLIIQPEAVGAPPPTFFPPVPSFAPPFTSDSTTNAAAPISTSPPILKRRLSQKITFADPLKKKNALLQHHPNSSPRPTLHRPSGQKAKTGCTPSNQLLHPVMASTPGGGEKSSTELLFRRRISRRMRPRGIARGPIPPVESSSRPSGIMDIM